VTFFATTGALTMSSREIAELVDSRHDKVRQSIERLVERGVISLPPTGEVKIQRERRMEAVKVYVFSGEQGKRDSIIVVAQLCPEFTARLVDRWQELEAQVARPDPGAALRDPAALRHLLLGYTEKVIALEAKVEADAPKVAALDRLEASEGSVNVRIAAKMLNVPERKFTKWLQANGWAFRQNGVGPLQAYHVKREAGLLEHRPHTYRDQQRDEDRTVPQMMVTPKGLARLAALFGKGQGELL
jgi:phage antirepressor YoqD-like protein